MTDPIFLHALVVLFAAALPIVVVFQRFNIPTIVGFLVAGIVIGPHGLGLIAQSREVESVAEVGLVLLLFVVGIELSFAQLIRLGRRVVWSGILQVVVTAGLVFAAARVAGLETRTALLCGFLLTHSSTAIVLKTLADRGELDAPHGRTVIGILLIQDLSLVPMVLLTRLLATGAAASWSAVGGVLAQAVLALGLIVATARLALPALLRQVVRLRSRELFTGTIVLFCVGTAWVASQCGLSLALGALIAGLVISESEYSHQALAEVLPFRDIFNSVFFLSVGMLLHLDFLFAHLGIMLAAAAGVLVFKAIILAGVMLPAYRSARTTLLTALSLAGLGELSFVLAGIALPSGLLGPAEHQAFVAIAVLTMLASPFVIHLAPMASAALVQWLRIPEPEVPPPAAVENHVVIIGYGLNGENLAHVLHETGITYQVLELNPDRVAAARASGEPVHYGDATRPEVLRSVSAATAQIIVIAISDPSATRRIVALARQANANAPIIVRTRYVSEIDQLHQLGATEVIPEEYETSVEIFARVLRRLHVPRNAIAVQVDLVRREGYRMLRGLHLPTQTLDQLSQILAATTTDTCLVPSGSPVVGTTVRELKLGRIADVTIIAIVRSGQPITNPPPDLMIEAGDIVVMLGSHAQLDAAMAQLAPEPDLRDPST